MKTFQVKGRMTDVGSQRAGVRGRRFILTAKALRTRGLFQSNAPFREGEKLHTASPVASFRNC